MTRSYADRGGNGETDIEVLAATPVLPEPRVKKGDAA
jgi:hypothetical protein